MEKKRRHKLIISVLSLVFSVILTITAVLAWMPTPVIVNGALLYSGNIDLEVALYLGIDEDKNGILEIKEGAADPNLLFEDASRAEKIENFYESMDKRGAVNEDDGSFMPFEHSDIVPGDSVTFKLVILNRAELGADAAISLNFAKMDQYIYSAVEYFAGHGILAETNQQVANIFNFAEDNKAKGSAGRTVFSLTNIKISVYAGYETDGIETGFDHIIRTSDAVEAAALNKTHIEGVSDKKLWEVSDGEAIVGSNSAYRADGTVYDDTRINNGELMEIDFRLTYMQLDNTLAADYNEYNTSPEFIAKLKEKFKENDSLLDDMQAKILAEDYIELLTREEIIYLFGEEEDSVDKKNAFIINRIIVKGRQLPKGAGV